MKNFILIGLIIISLFSCASNKGTETVDKTAPQVYEHAITNDKPHYKITLLWLADTINDSRSSIEFKDEDMQIIKGTVASPTIMYPKWFDYTIRITETTITMSCSNFRQGTKKVPIFTTGEYNSFKKDTAAFAASLFDYLDTFQ